MAATVEQAGTVVFRAIDGRIEVLLIRARRDPAHRIFPKGHIDPGEDAAGAALREAEEEAGVIGRIVQALDPLEFHDGRSPVRVHYFLVEATGARTPDEDDRDPVWLSPEGALDTLTHRGARDMLRLALPHMSQHVIRAGII
jgi:8-oxo-dGTP pyrophosphatase MutT (NUDIX family)